MRVTVKRELACNALWQGSECLSILLGQVSQDILALCSLVKVLIVSSVLSKQVIQLVNEATD